MSGRARAPPPPAEGGLPSLGLLSLKEAPVAAKASVYELELEGEGDGWISIDEEEVVGRSKTFEFENGNSDDLWSETYEETKDEDGKVERKLTAYAWNWDVVHRALCSKMFNQPWLHFYQRRSNDGLSEDGSKWLGWSNFSFFDDSARRGRGDLYYYPAHFMADEDDEGVKKARDAMRDIINDPWKKGDYDPFKRGFPGHSIDDLVKACKPLFDHIRKIVDKKLITGTHGYDAVSYTHLRAHETPEHLVCRLLLEKKK